MKVKIIFQDDLDELEKTINDFIKGKKIIDIKLTSTSDKRFGLYVIALIFYYEGK